MPDGGIWRWPSSSRAVDHPPAREATQQAAASSDLEARLISALLSAERAAAAHEQQFRTLEDLLERLQQCVAALEIAVQNVEPPKEEVADVVDPVAERGLIRSYPLQIGVGFTLGLIALVLAYYLFWRG
jgi:hypothetical protein